MRNSLSKLPKTVKWSMTILAGIVSGILMSWVLLSDEALNPEAKLVLEAAPKIAPEQNAFYALWGFRASPALDAFEVGKQIISAQAAALRSGGYTATFAPETYWGGQPFQDNSLPLRYCKGISEKQSCLTALSEQREVIETKLREQDLYVQRYRALRRYSRYEDAMAPTPNVPMLPWHTVMKVGELVDAKIVFDMTEPPKRAAALAELNAEIVLWKTISRGASTMLSRMMSTAQLGHKYRLASELLTEYPQIANEHRDIVAKITQPLTPADINMQRMFEGEFRYAALAIHNVRYDANVNSKGVAELSVRSAWIAAPWEELTLKRNATINMQYSDVTASGNFYSQSAAEVVTRQNEFSEKLNHYKPFRPSLWLYNPVGKIVSSIASPQYERYAYRIHDLAGYSRLVELQRQVALSHTPLTKTGEMIAAADINLLDPYTGKSMVFDATAQTISFTTKGSISLDEQSLSVKLAN
jgi:hypothetical protein